jgi:hypothetical protein
MKWLLKGFTAVVLFAVVMSALLIGAALFFGAPFEHAVIHVDDTSFTIGELGLGHWLLAFAGIVLAFVIVMLVTPIAVLLPLAFAAISVVVALAFAAVVVGIALSPLLLIGWLIWLIWRHARSPSPATPPAATMAG